MFLIKHKHTLFANKLSFRKFLKICHKLNSLSHITTQNYILYILKLTIIRNFFVNSSRSSVHTVKRKIYVVTFSRCSVESIYSSLYSKRHHYIHFYVIFSCLGCSFFQLVDYHHHYFLHPLHHSMRTTHSSCWDLMT